MDNFDWFTLSKLQKQTDLQPAFNTPTCIGIKSATKKLQQTMAASKKHDPQR